MSVARVHVLMIHGVGDAPGEQDRRVAEGLIAARASEPVAVRWHSWNDAIGKADPQDEAWLGSIARSARVASRLEITSGERRIARRLLAMESAIAVAEPTCFALLLLSLLWLALTRIMQCFPEDPMALGAGLRLRHVLLPPLDPILLAGTASAAATTALLMGTVVAASLAARGLFLWGSRTVPLRVVARSIILDVVRPAVALILVPLQSLPVVMLAGIVGIVVVLASRPVQPFAMDGTALAGLPRLGCFTWAGWLLAAAGVTAIAWAVLRTPFKVLSDIVRYLGDGQYRQRIHAHLEAVLNGLDDKPVVVVAHSLGSVIAVDSLLACTETWARFPAVRLVTCGSPLRRFFHRFFPKSYPSPDLLAASLRSQYASAAWLNMYRPLDYVGGCLAGGVALRNHQLPQRRRLHIGYWTDPAAMSVIAGEIKVVAHATAVARVVPATPALPVDRLRGRVPGGDGALRGLLTGVFVVGLLVSVFNQWAWVPRIEGEQVARWTSQLAVDGVDAQGELRPAREEDVSGDHDGVARAIGAIAWKDADGHEHTIVAGDDARPDINWDHVHSVLFGRPLDSVLWTGIKATLGIEDPLLAKTDAVSVAVRYLRSDARCWRLPSEFHQGIGVSQAKRLGRWVALGFLWALWMFFCGGAVCVSLGVSGFWGTNRATAGGDAPARPD